MSRNDSGPNPLAYVASIFVAFGLAIILLIGSGVLANIASTVTNPAKAIAYLEGRGYWVWGQGGGDLDDTGNIIPAADDTYTLGTSALTWDRIYTTPPLVRGQTLVVCASNALYTEQCDYTADGTADDVEIEAADSALATTSGTIVLSEGTFSTTGNITLSPNVALVGQGYATLIVPTGSSITNAIVLSDYSQVRNLRIDLADGAGAAASRPNVIYASAVTGVVIDTVWLYGDESVADDASDQRQNGVLFSGVTDSRVLHSYIQDTRRHGIRALSSSQAHNLYYGNRVTSTTMAGISIYQETYSQYIANRVTSSATGIEANAASYSVFQGNILRSNTNYGMDLSRLSYADISDNIATGHGFDGIRVRGVLGAQADYNTLTGNVCTGNGDNGIEVTGDAAGGNTYANGNVVSGNQLNGNTGDNLYDDATNTVIGSNYN